VVVDLGTGDGKAVIRRARREPQSLVIGIDANAAAMAESSRRAARAADRGGLSNALFVVAAAERLPVELAGIADELTIQFPWGSLLRGALAVDDTVAAGIAGLLRPGGSATVVFAITDRDRVAAPNLGDDSSTELASHWAYHGLRLAAFDRLSAAEVDATGSSWARRLSAGQSRPAWRLELWRLELSNDGPGGPR
jgi:16S rRNA (adenine(1408)-N(1))-methyltransferase